ncbi:MAG TPA: hypothetical protein VIO58_04715 [Candidatus Methanoperedens sp.]
MKCKYSKEALEMYCDRRRDPDSELCWNIEELMKKCKYFTEVDRNKSRKSKRI